MILQPAPAVGALLRDWRRRRRLSQLDLALHAEISARHLSFVETGRAQPSRAMILRLAERLDLPLRARNALLLAAGFAPAFPERGPSTAEFAMTRALVDRVLMGHEPYPALALDRHWNVVAANRAMAPLLDCVAPHLRQPPVNVLRNSLHPDGLASRILNYGEWRAHLLARLRRQVYVTADPALDALVDEVTAFPFPPGAVTADDDRRESDIAVPLRFMSPIGELNLISSTMVFGTAVDVTLSELALETFFPLDADTATALFAMAKGISE